MLFIYVKGANICAKSRTGATALTEAASNGHTQIVHLLNRHIMSAKSQLGIMLCLSLSFCLGVTEFESIVAVLWLTQTLIINNSDNILTFNFYLIG